MTIRLYHYWRSSAAYRVRIALNLKGLAYEAVPVSLVDAEHRSAAYLQRNPQGLVPFLEDGTVAVGQSVAIIEYLDSCYPEPQLLPGGAAARAEVRQLVNIIACDIHPLCNLRVLNYLREQFQADQQAIKDWYANWVQAGFVALERHLQQLATGRFCYGDSPGLADVYLVPQLYNAERFGVALDDFPRIREIGATCNSLASFQMAAPENWQADSV